MPSPTFHALILVRGPVLFRIVPVRDLYTRTVHHSRHRQRPLESIENGIISWRILS